MTANEMASEPNPPVDVQASTPTPSVLKNETKMDKPEEQVEYPSTAKTWIIMISLYIAMFLVALDKTILATAIPRITDSFSSLSDIGWYGSAYMLTFCGVQFVWGKIYSFTTHNPKTPFLCSILIFEIGSAICGAAPTSTAFIIGRAIAGLGSSGVFAGCVVVIIAVVPLEKRPVYQGLMGAVFGVSSVAGPLLGGVFTEKVSWRWCFYINLPCGAVAVAILLLVLRLPSKTEKDSIPLKEKLLKLDPIGTTVFTASVVCLLIALQWGGTTYTWSDWRIILPLTLFPILFIVWLAIQIQFPDTATLPMRILTQRTMAAGVTFAFCSQASMLVIVYYVPLFFQALRDFSPVNAGLATLPAILGLVIGGILAGGMVQRFGYPAPFMVASAVLSTVGAGLISTWQINVRQGMWIGYQVLLGVGIGIGMQQPSMMAQIVLPKVDQPIGVSLMVFGQNFGGAIFVSVAQSVFTDGLVARLGEIPGLNLSRKMVAETGATIIKEMVPSQYLDMVLEGYRLAIRNAFYVGLALAAFSIVGAVLVEWRSIKEGQEKRGATGNGEEHTKEMV